MRQLLKEEIKSVLTEKSFKKLLSESIKKEFISEGLLKYDKELFAYMCDFYEACMGHYYRNKILPASSITRTYLEEFNAVQELYDNYSDISKTKSEPFAKFFKDVDSFNRDFSNGELWYILDAPDALIEVPDDIADLIAKQIGKTKSGTPEDEVSMSLSFREIEKTKLARFSKNAIEWMRKNIDREQYESGSKEGAFDFFWAINHAVHEGSMIIAQMEVYGVTIFAEASRRMEGNWLDETTINFYNDAKFKKEDAWSHTLKNSEYDEEIFANETSGAMLIEDSLYDIHQSLSAIDHVAISSLGIRTEYERNNEISYSEYFNNEIYFQIFEGGPRATRSGKEVALGYYLPSYQGVGWPTIVLYTSWKKERQYQARDSIEKHTATLRHELQHHEQYTQEKKKSLKKGQYGRPEKYFEDKYDEDGFREDHAIRGVEFYTRLSDEMYRITSKLIVSPPEYAKSIFLNHLAQTEFFQKIKEHRPVWYRKAIKLAWIEIHKELKKGKKK
jgi:hypothetical protein